MWGQVTRSGQVTQLQNNFPIAPRLQCFRESYETFRIWWAHQCLPNVYLGFLISWPQVRSFLRPPHYKSMGKKSTPLYLLWRKHICVSFKGSSSSLPCIVGAPTPSTTSQHRMPRPSSRPASRRSVGRPRPPADSGAPSEGRRRGGHSWAGGTVAWERSSHIWVESYRIGQLWTIRVKICIANPSKGHLRSPEVTNHHLPITFDQRDRDVGLVSVRSSWPGESNDMQYDPFRSSRDLGVTWPEIKLSPWPFKVILYMVRRALTRQTRWCQICWFTFNPAFAGVLRHPRLAGEGR